MMTEQDTTVIRNPRLNRENATICQRGIKEKHRVITYKDLPLSCPLPNECLWDSHPRVYLTLDEHGFTRCPYCSREFVLGNEK